MTLNLSPINVNETILKMRLPNSFFLFSLSQKLEHVNIYLNMLFLESKSNKGLISISHKSYKVATIHL